MRTFSTLMMGGLLIGSCVAQHSAIGAKRSLQENVSFKTSGALAQTFKPINIELAPRESTMAKPQLQIKNTSWVFPSSEMKVDDAKLAGLSLQNEARFVCPSYSVGYELSAEGSYEGDISLRAVGLPGGVNSLFGSSSVKVGEASTMTMKAEASVPPGSYHFTIEGTGENFTASIEATLVVLDGCGQ